MNDLQNTGAIASWQINVKGLPSRIFSTFLFYFLTATLNYYVVRMFLLLFISYDSLLLWSNCFAQQVLGRVLGAAKCGQEAANMVLIII